MWPIEELQDVDRFQGRLAKYELNRRHWSDPALVFTNLGHNDNDSAEAVEYIPIVLNYIGDKKWDKRLSCIQFRGFRSLDFTPILGPRRDPLQRISGFPQDLVFSDCVIANYYSLERLALRVTWGSNSAFKTRITLDKGTSIWPHLFRDPCTPRDNSRYTVRLLDSRHLSNNLEALRQYSRLDELQILLDTSSEEEFKKELGECTSFSLDVETKLNYLWHS